MAKSVEQDDGGERIHYSSEDVVKHVIKQVVGAESDGKNRSEVLNTMNCVQPLQTSLWKREFSPVEYLPEAIPLCTSHSGLWRAEMVPGKCSGCDLLEKIHHCVILEYEYDVPLRAVYALYKRRQK